MMCTVVNGTLNTFILSIHYHDESLLYFLMLFYNNHSMSVKIKIIPLIFCFFMLH